jgi:hypothetical protein
MEDVYAKLEQAALYIERNPAIVKSITSFPYIVRSVSYASATHKPSRAAELGCAAYVAGDIGSTALRPRRRPLDR